MDIRYSGNKLKVTKGIQEHFQDKLVKLERYSPKLVESHVILKKKKYGYEAEITVLGKKFRAYGEGKDKDNIYSAIDTAYHRVEKQLKKHREKVKEHHKGHGGEEVKVPKLKLAKKVSAAEPKTKKKKKIVRIKDFDSKPMLVEEAFLQLDMAKESLLVFVNASTKKVNVMFKMNDGNFGLVEPDAKK